MEVEHSQEDSFSKEKSYSKALERGIRRIGKNKALWWWAFLLPTGLSFLTFDFSSQKKQKDLFSQIPETVVDNFVNFFSTHWLLMTLIFFVGVILSLIFYLASIIARGGVVWALNELQNKNKKATINSKLIWAQGQVNFLGILKIDLILFLISLLTFLALICPIMYLMFVGKTGGVAILAFLAFIIFLPILFVSLFLKTVGVIFIIFSRQSLASIGERIYQLLISHPREALKAFACNFLLEIAKNVIIILMLFAILLIGGGFGWMLVLFGLPMFPIFLTIGVVSLVLIIIVGLTLRAFFALLTWDFWLWWIKSEIGIKEESIELASALELRSKNVVLSPENE